MTPALIASYIFLFFLIVAFLIAFGGVIFRKFAREYFSLQLIEVKFPATVKSPQHVADVGDIEKTNEFIKRLNLLGINFSLEVAVHGIGEAIHFYVTAGRGSAKKIIEIINSIWPAAKAELADDYDLWLDASRETSTGTGYLENRAILSYSLNHAQHYPIPIKTPKKAILSPFSPILAVLSQLKSLGEGVAIQYVVKPANPGISESICQLINKITSGKYQPPTKLLPDEFLITPEGLKKLEFKVSQPLLAVNGRILIAAKNKDRAEEIYTKIKNSFKNNEPGFSNEIKPVRERNLKTFIQGFLTRYFIDGETLILNSLELATLFQVPEHEHNFPKISRI